MILQMLIRLLGLGLIGLGLMFWSGNSLQLIPVHMRLGEILIMLLWILCGIAMRAGISAPFVLGVILYGVFVIGFAMRMGSFMPEAHELVRILHLVIGLVAIGAAEMVGAKIKRT